MKARFTDTFIMGFLFGLAQAAGIEVPTIHI